MITTHTKTTLMHFHDFYYLQALQAGIATKLSGNPESQFRRAVIKLQQDVTDYAEEFIPNLALRTFVYLYAACLGEARHANTPQAERRFIPETRKRGRHDLFASVTDFPPTRKNLLAVVGAFNQNWLSGYGGPAWKGIAEALLDYGKISDTAWLDHVVDLEHNNGTAFNKSDARETIHFETRYTCDFKFSMFLDYKFSKDIMTKVPRDAYGDKIRLMVTGKLYRLVERYCIIFGEMFPEWLRPQLETLGEYEIVWGEKSLSLEEKWYNWVSTAESNDPDPRQVFTMTGIEEYYPPNLTQKQWKSIVNKAKKTAKAVCGTHWTKSLAIAVNRRINNYYAQWVGKCKVAKCKKTYSILPVKITAKDGMIFLFAPIPHENVGKAVEGGVEFELDAKKNHILIPESLTNGGCVDGHVNKGYAKLVVQCDDTIYPLYNAKELEALID